VFKALYKFVTSVEFKDAPTWAMAILQFANTVFDLNGVRVPALTPVLACVSEPRDDALLYSCLALLAERFITQCPVAASPEPVIAVVSLIRPLGAEPEELAMCGLKSTALR